MIYSGSTPVRQNSLVVYDESGHMEFPFLFAVLSWGGLG